MGKCIFIISGLMLALLLIGTCSSQGMGDRKGYDWMGTPVSSDENAHLPDYLNPYTAGKPEWDPYGPGTNPQLGRPEWDPFGPNGRGGYGAYNLQLEPADPTRESLAIKDSVRLPNQLYLQRGPELVTQGGVLLGEPYTLWARVAGRGSFTLYDYNNLVLSQGYITPGWYKINGAYADFLGQHLYRFVSAGLASNNLSLVADSGGYPTSFSLTGQVVDQYGKGMSGVRVILSNNEGGTFSTVTGASGYYGMDVATGVYLINAELPGYRFTPSTAHVWTGVVSAARPLVGYPVSSYPLFRKDY